MSQLFNFSFQNLQSVADSPGAINKNQVVYAYATQSTKTLLVLTNGESRITNNPLTGTTGTTSVKSYFGLTSIGSPTRANGQVVSIGEVLVNNDYVTQVFDDTTARRVEMSQPASAPVVFTTAATLTGIVANSFAGEKGYKEWIGSVSFNTTGTPTETTLYNTIGVTPTFAYSTGSVNGVGAGGYWTMDFSGVLTSGNISLCQVDFAPGAGSSNNNQFAKVNMGTTEAPSSIVFSNWQATTTSNSTLIGVMQVSVKFFG
jgi:hypothetical protein